jgi:hypothetical protein
MKTNLPCIQIKPIQILVGLFLFALLAGTQPVQATRQTPPAPAEPNSAGLQSLETLLNPDGTLDLSNGFSGSLDAAGWQVSAGPGGEPRFTRSGAPSHEGNAPTAAGDEYWDDQFILGVYDSENPTSSYVFVITVSGTDVYLGGDFDHAGDVAANRIAKWDSLTHKWSALGSGTSGRVYAIAVSGEDVYAGGAFSRAGGIHTGPIAYWNDATHTWSALGDELTHENTSPDVNAIAIAGNGDVYVGGNFEAAGSLTVNSIARWDGSSWHNLTTGIQGTYHDVNAITISGSDVYVGGYFDTAGGWTHNNIARWNGSAWFSLGSGTGGVYPMVYAIAIYGSNIFVGGNFNEVTDSTNGTQAVGNIAMWNGVQWSTMGGGLDEPEVYTLALGPDDNLYVGGRFTTLADGSTSMQHLAMWDGTTWHSIGGGGIVTGNDGVDDQVHALGFIDDQLYLGGRFNYTNDGRTLNYVGYYDISDDEWYALGNSVNGTVNALAVDGEDVYIGGIFTSAGGLKALGIARWHQRTGDWYSLRGGVSGCTGPFMPGCRPVVYAIYVDGSDVYVGGNFTQAGTTDAHGIARWDTETQSWYALGDGVTCSGIGCRAYVRAISKTGTLLYVGGTFDYAGGSLVENAAVWTGSAWYELFPGTNGIVYALEALSTNEVYIGGNFTSPSDYIAKCNDIGCTSLNADTVNGAVYAIKQKGYLLYVAGAFTNLGGPNGDYMTTFHNNDWFQMDGDGLDNVVYALGSIPGPIFAAGDFTLTGILGMNRVGKFYGSTWSGYGSGADDTVYAVAPSLIQTSIYTLYIGGSFLNAGDKPSAYFGRNGGLSYLYLPTTMK